MRSTRAYVTKEFKMCCAHLLPNHSGKCSQPHGHNYRMEFTLSSIIPEKTGASDEGMVVDFYDLKYDLIGPIVNHLDHQDLNERLPVEYHPTTAENLAKYFFDEVEERLITFGYDDVRLESVRVWETDTGSATVYHEAALP